ncbi:hypothetical protein TSAR_004475 [Trichomalopsis sarcophagae]|uniref:Probable deoxycytidylate deaminase n=1 Tax=Trichomalopsis sarcophagae TaxID=543379 RepID=A0A232EEY8_9HYME|nr:hypothetical protein TSAR_004475 [Trichomalopsis sarcophagae]
MTEDSSAVEILCNGVEKCSVQTRDLNNKRTDFLDWDDYFMSVAFLASMRSKDPCTQVGACIVNEDKKIVGVGYNGMPIGCNDDDFSWKKAHESELDSKFLYVCHAELNAILNKNSENVKNCTLYVGLFPCNECAKVIIQSGIKRVFYMSDKHAHKVRTKAAKRMFDAAKVEYCQYKPKHEKIVIDFGEINWNDMTQLPPTPVKSG